MKKRNMRLMQLLLLLGFASGLSAAQAGASAINHNELVNRNALVEIEFDNLPDFYRWCRPNPESCLAALCSEIEELEPVAERIISVVDALELETCPATLIHNVDLPITLTASGRYCLAEDLLVTTTGIIIDGSGITLDLNCHSIILTNTSAIGVAVDGDPAHVSNSDIVIKNGTVVDYVGHPDTTGI